MVELTPSNLVLSCWYNRYSINQTANWLQACCFMVDKAAIDITFSFHDKNTKRSDLRGKTLDMHEIL